MALTLNRISLAFDGKEVLADFSYSFPERGCVFLTGVSGSGKTTLLRLIAGLLTPDSGTVVGNESVSVAFQEHRLFPSLNAAENIAVAAFGNKRNLADAEEILRFLGFTPEETHLYPAALSGGMKQRVSLARAFLKKAPILLLDEPFKELDPALSKTVADRIRKESETRLVILTSHSAESADKFRALVISTDADR